MPDFGPPILVNRIAQSTTIDYNNGTITQAKMTIVLDTTQEINDYDYYLTADGGTNWESTTPGILHTFTNTGTDLRWKIIGYGIIEAIVVEGYH